MLHRLASGRSKRTTFRGRAPCPGARARGRGFPSHSSCRRRRRRNRNEAWITWARSAPLRRRRRLAPPPPPPPLPRRAWGRGRRLHGSARRAAKEEARVLGFACVAEPRFDATDFVLSPTGARILKPPGPEPLAAGAVGWSSPTGFSASGSG